MSAISIHNDREQIARTVRDKVAAKLKELAEETPSAWGKVLAEVTIQDGKATLIQIQTTHQSRI